MNAQPVKIKYSFLKILTGSDLSRRRLPLMQAESVNPGPVLFLTACAHGDEVGGIAVIQEVFKQIRTQLLRGSVIAFPLMNPTGFETTSRSIVMSEEDLNRSFPGNPRGTLAQRIADIIFTHIVNTRPAVVLDLHNDWSRSIPYAVIDPMTDPGCAEAYDKTLRFASMTGFINVLEPEEHAHENTLTCSLIKINIPALVLELGESYVVNETNIRFGIDSIFNILRELEMVKSAGEPFLYPAPEIARSRVLHYFERPLSSTSGIIRLNVKPGDFVRKGRKLARIYNAFGKHLETLTAMHDGIVLGTTDYSVAFPGATVIVFGNL